MDFAIEAAAFAKALGMVKGCVPARATIPILSHVHITASAGNVTVRGTDLQMEAVASIGADVATDGSVTVPGDILHGIASRLPKSGMVALASEGDRVSVTCNRAKYALRVLPPDDFPEERAMPPNAVRFSMPAADLLAMLTATRHSISTEETRFYLCGTFLCVRGDQLVAVSTDGHRLTRRTLPLLAGAESLPSVIVPRYAVAELIGLLSGVDGDVFVAVTENLFRVEAGPVALTTKLIDGTYPDYERVIPQSNGKTATVAVGDLAEAMNRAAAVLAGTRGAPVKIETIADGLEIDAKATEGDNGTEIISAEIDKQGAYAGLNSKYFAELLSNWPSESIDIQISDPGSPLLFTSPECPEITAVIMPMRV